MKTETLDPVELFARLDPLSAGRLAALADGAEQERTFARISARLVGISPRTRRLTRGRVVAAAVVVVALAIPALAAGGVLSSLLSFSNRGTPVARHSLSAVSAFDLSGAKRNTVVQLAARDGVGIYAAKTAAGDLCYFIGPRDRARLKAEGLGGGCLNAKASASFPSPGQPVVDISLYALAPGAAGPSIQRLAGVAADGVSSVQVLALADCHVVTTAPVRDNVYVAGRLPMTPEAVIVARDAAGNAVWHEAVAPPSDANATSCGLG